VYLLDDISISRCWALVGSTAAEGAGYAKKRGGQLPARFADGPLTYFRKSMKKGGSVKVKTNKKSGMMLWGN
jgi:hypothetical protein